MFINNYEIYLKAPTPFLVANWNRLLGNCKVRPQAIAIILFESRLVLDNDNDLIQQEKDHLLLQFLALGERFKRANTDRKLWSDVISPQDGKPLYSEPGDLIFDLVAIVHDALGLSFSRTAKGCKMLDHPLWNNAVYPGLFLAEITPQELNLIINNLIKQ
jgi:hypothetical protein